MAREIQLDLGINGAFITRRWEDPHNWMRLTRELGYDHHEFCGDVLDPFFSGDRDYQVQTARQVKQAAEEYNITITDIYTGVATHRFHGLSHSHPACRQRMAEWITSTMDLARQMGTDRVGGHWDAISCEVMQNAGDYQAAIDRLCRTFVDLAAEGADRGMEAIYLEQMYIPSEVPWTLDQAEYILTQINREDPAIPVYLTIDVGHMAGMHYGLEGPDLDYLEWTRRFAPFSEIIHLQQTTPDASAHWAFTEEYNEKGHIEIEPLIEAIQQAHEDVENNPVSEHMEPVDRTWMIAEIIPGSTKHEDELLDELKISAEYLKQWMPGGTLTLNV
jgi:sugar phosphate isomerase/epimerase